MIICKNSINFASGMEKKSANTLKYILWIALAAVLLYFSFRGVDWAQFGSALASCRWGYVVLSIGLGALVYFLRALRWRMQILPLDPSTGRLTCLNAYNLCMITNLVLPRVGELVRCGYVAKHSARDEEGNRLVSVDKALGTVVLDRLWDALSMGVMILIFLALMWKRFGTYLSENVTAGLLSHGDHGLDRDYGDILALAPDVSGVVERDDELGIGIDRAGSSGGALVEHEDYRVVVPDGSLEQALYVSRIVGRYDLEAGNVLIPGLCALGVVAARSEASVGPSAAVSHEEDYGAALDALGHESYLGGAVDHSVSADGGEVREHHIDYRAISADCGAYSEIGEACLSDRHVQAPVRELLGNSHVDAQSACAVDDVFTKQYNFIVAGHLFCNRSCDSAVKIHSCH